MYATLMFGESQVRTGYLVVGMLATRNLKHALLQISPEFDKIKLEALTDDFRTHHRRLTGRCAHGDRRIQRRRRRRRVR